MEEKHFIQLDGTGGNALARTYDFGSQDKARDVAAWLSSAGIKCRVIGRSEISQTARQ